MAATVFQACAATALIAAAPAAGQTHPQRASTPHLESLRRLVRHFDFEEATLAPYQMPLYFHRFDNSSFRDEAPLAHGFPTFGQMRLVSDAACTGRWSFGFELEGGSMAARIPTAVIPVIPLSDYVVTVQIRTEGLEHARAGLSVWFADDRGRRIGASERSSRLVKTAGRWEAVNVELPGQFAHAADLCVQLHLLQPRQYLAGDAPRDTPLLEDVRGKVWFDDLMIWHAPRIELTTDAPGNVITGQTPPRLNVLVRDLAGNTLTARLRVLDFDGRVVHDETFPAPRGRAPIAMAVPITRFGWYRAVLDVEEGGSPIGRRWLDFVLLAPQSRRVPPERHDLAVILPWITASRRPATVELVRRLDVGEVIVPVWPDIGEPATTDAAARATLEAIESLLADGRRIIFSLDAVPQPLAESMALDRTQVLDLMTRDSSAWRPYLDELLTRFGLEVPSWQLGATRRAEGFWMDDLDRLVAAGTRALAEFIPAPTIYVPWSSEQSLPSESRAAAYHVAVAREVRPEAIDAYAAGWQGLGDDLLLSFDELPADEYAPRRRIGHLMLQALHAWRAGIPRLAIAAPWQTGDASGRGPKPDPAFPIWQQLGSRLGGRTYAGELQVADDVRCWIAEGSDPDDAALIAWCVSDPPRGDAVLTLQREARTLEVADAFGNPRSPEVHGDVITIPLDDLPVFIEGIDANVAKLRAGFALDPPFVTSMHRVQNHHLVLRNPWPGTITGSLRLGHIDGLRFSPTVHEFHIEAGGEARLPVSIIATRNILAGPRVLEAEVSLAAAGAHDLRMTTDLEVGWQDLELIAIWRVVTNQQTGREDLLITGYVSNRGRSAMSQLDVYLAAPNLRQSRKPLSSLGPGETATRSFHVPDGAALLAGQVLRVGVSERNGVARLNTRLRIPDSIAPRRGSVTSADAAEAGRSPR